MKGVGLRLPVEQIKRRLRRLREMCRAKDFVEELNAYTTRTLKGAMNTTPVRRPSLIEKAQVKQYEHRINYIPSYHDLTDPALRVKEDGTQFLYFRGKWYRPDIHKIPEQAWSAYVELANERQQRIQMSEADFIEYRKQARFLYRKTWWQVGLSLNLPVLASAGVQDSVTRRRNPIVQPPKAYGQRRGGETTISYAIYNPFLAIPSVYITFDGQEILEASAIKEKPRFIRAVEARVQRQIVAARKA